MAKIKVHEIAKELEKQSKEIIAFLQDKGIEVKSHQSSLEDDVADMIRKAFEKREAAPEKAEAEAETETKMTAPVKTAQEGPEKTQENREVKSGQNAGEQPKKKKKIIFVSNPHNSNMPGQRTQNDRRPAQGGNRPAGANRQGQGKPAQEAPHKIIRPLTAPSMPESMQVDFKQNAKRLENEKQAAKSAQTHSGQTQNVQTQSVQTQNVAESVPPVKENAVPKNSQRDERHQKNERTQGNAGNNQGERPARNDSRRPEGANRSGNQNGRSDFRGNNTDRNNNRSGNNSGRPERGSQGQDNRFKRTEKPGKSFAAEAPVKEEKRRDEEKRRMGQERDKKSRKDFMYEDDEIAIKSKNKAGRFIKPEKKTEEVVEEQIKVITIPESLTIKELADKMKLQPSAIIKKLFLQGQIVTVNSEISFEDAENIAIEYEIICEKEIKVDVIEELLKEEDEEEDKLENRPPVICVMGHVDHGKTSLLDAIRKTNVTDKEAGGITQHIGAYTVNINGQSITFLDTPGHEAFTAMRMRGANSTDIAILVVAADDGVMPQTIEAINHAKAAGIEIIVAVNKIDKESANVERVKQELMEYELVAEDWGGSTVFCPVSAHTKEGIDNLLEMILLTAEVLELKANPNRKARGIVIEAELDKGRGPVATILVQKGTLRIGDSVAIGNAYGKVRAMVDDKGRKIKEAGPSMPVEILGLNSVPGAGEICISTSNEKEARSMAEAFIAYGKEKLLADTKAKMSLDDLFSQIQAGNIKELNLVIKADVQGSVEAVKNSLLKLSNEEVVVKAIHSGVGAINESDVILASASNAIIIGFNVRPDVQAKSIAEREKVDLRLYKVIYNAIEDIESAMKGMLDPVFEEKIIGHAEVRQLYKASQIGTIAGSYVLDGVIQRNCSVRIYREGDMIHEGALASLKRFKDDVKEVKSGFECGLVFEGYNDIKEEDQIEAYIMVEVPR